MSDLQMVRRVDASGECETFGPMHPELARELADRSLELGYYVERWQADADLI